MMTDENTRNDVKKQEGSSTTPNAGTMPNASTTPNASTMSGTSTALGTNTILGTNEITGTDKLIGVPPEKLHEIANHVRSVADGLARTLMAASTLADSLQALINDMPAQAGHDQENAIHAAGTVQATSENKQQEAASPSTSATSTQDDAVHSPEPISLVDLRAYVAARSTPDKRPKIREALLKYGVKRLTDLQPAQYAAFKAEVDAL